MQFILLLLFIVVIQIPNLLFAESIKIGIIAGFTSVLSSEAEEIRNGVNMAIRDINHDAQNKYTFSSEENDTQLNPQKISDTLADFTEGGEDIRYLIGFQTSEELMKFVPFAQNMNILAISPAARSDNVTSLNSNIFRTRHSQKQESEFFAPYVRRYTQRKPLGAIILSSLAGTTQIQSFKENFNKLGGSFAFYEDLEIASPNYDRVLERMRINSISDLYMLGLSVQVADMMIEAADAGLKVRFFGTSDNHNQIILNRAGKSAEGFIIPYPFDAVGNPASAAFANRYNSEFGQPPSYIAANSYDAAMILNLCLNKVGDNPTAVKSCLFYIRDYNGAGGPLSIDRNGNAKRELFLETVHNGKFMKLKITN